ncbi:MAG: ABC transporter ATP-binding protein, partial [Erysipelotrichaceae bacterium]
MARLPGPRNYLTEEEKNNKPKVTLELLLRIFSYLKPYWFQLLLVLFIIIVSAICGLLPSIITGKIIDSAIIGKDFALLLKLSGLAIFALTFSQVIAVLESFINSWISAKIVFDMKNEMFAHLQTMPVSFFNSEKQGEIITRMNTDISGVSTVISQTLTNFISNVCTVATTIVALFSIDWQLAIVGLIVIPLLVLPTKTAGKNRWKYLSQSQAKNDELNDIINETLSPSGSLLVKLFNQQEKKNQQFQKVNKEVTDLSIKEARAGKWFKVAMGIFTNLGPLLIYLAGGYLIIVRLDSTLTVGTITATVTMINCLYRPVESLLNISVDFTRSLALFSRIFSYLDLESDIKNCPNPTKPDFSI